jgi:hypothetical protein
MYAMCASSQCQRLNSGSYFSTPESNSWPTFHDQEGSLVAGVQALEGASAQLCQPATALHVASAADLTRAARHYQRAVEMLIARQVSTCRCTELV